MINRKLANGLEIAIKENHFSKMVALQCWVGVGSLWEESHEYGMAHCLEHMLFKGTENYDVGEISAKVEAFGGDINAYTSFDRTVFYLTISSEYLKDGISLLADAVLRSTFDAGELVKEKEVILEEIRRSLDQPSHLLGRKVFEQVYAGTPAARPIIGYVETVEKFQRADLVKFHKDWYTPDNMRLIVVGDVDSAQVFELVEGAFGRESGRCKSKLPLQIATNSRDFSVHVIEGDYEQARVEIAYNAPDQNDFDAVELDLAAFVLAAGESSRLVRKLRDEKSYASTIGASLYAPDFSGIFELSAMPSDGHLLDCIRELASELARLKYHHPINSEELQRARANLKADRLHQEESVAGQARALGYGLTTPHKLAYDAVYDARISASNSETIYNAVDRWINLDQPTIVVLQPKGQSISKNEIKDAYFEGVKLGKSGPIDRFVTLEKNSQELHNEDIFQCELAPGLKFTYRRNPHCGLFNLVAATEGGLRRETSTDAGLHNCLADMVATATEDLDNEQLTDSVEGHGAVLVGFSGKDSLGIRLQCFQEDTEQMVRLFASSILKPVFPETQWKNTKLDIYEDISAENDSPTSIAVKAFREAIYGSHPYRNPMYGSRENIDRFTTKSLLKSFLHIRDRQNWVLSGVGSDDPDKVVKMLRQHLKDWRPDSTGSAENLPSYELHAVSSEHHRIEKNREQTHIIVGGLGLRLNDRRRFTLDVLATVLGGSGGRLFVNLRDKQSLAYTVSPLLSYGCEPGVFGIYIACAPEKVTKARESIECEMRNISEVLVDSQELRRARNYLVGGHEASMQRGESQAMSMALMSLYGLGADEFLNYAKGVSAVTAEQVKELAGWLFDPSRLISVEVGDLDRGVNQPKVSNR